MSADDTPPLRAVFARSERMVGRRVADQFLLVPIVSRGADVDCLYNLNRVGTFIWERLDGRTPGSEIVEALVRCFEVERERAEEDYRGFVTSLVGIQAIAEVGPRPGPELA
jgi:hypothetical protein